MFFVLNVQIGNFNIGNQHAFARVVCDEDYYQCGTANTGCPKSYDSSYYVHITGYNTGITSCGVQCSASRILGKCGYTDIGKTCHILNGNYAPNAPLGKCVSTKTGPLYGFHGYVSGDCQGPDEVCMSNCSDTGDRCVSGGSCNSSEETIHSPTTCGHNTQTNSDNCCVPKIDEGDPCAPVHKSGSSQYPNGNYCGGESGNYGYSDHLYTCQNLQTTKDVKCAYGCSNGACNAAPKSNPPTATPTTKPNNGGSSPTATPTTNPKNPTATPTSAGSSKAKVILVLPAIGGKNGGNPVPHRSTRTITLYFYNPDQDPTDPAIEPVAVKTGRVSLDTSVGSLTYGSFVNNPSTGIDLTNLTGTYKVLVKTGSYLRKQFIPKNGDSSATFTFTNGQVTTLPQMTLIAGDIYPPASSATSDPGDNTLDISDYNLLVRQCYGNKSGCPSQTAADLNDDGNINGIDYNILIRSFRILSDEGSQGGDGE